MTASLWYRPEVLVFAFPADPLTSRRVDEYFAPQRDALREGGFSGIVLPPDVFRVPTHIGGVPPAAVVVYRGWMLDQNEYASFASSVTESGGVPHTSLEQYLLAHHLPNWYRLIPDLTPETVVLPADVDLQAELERLNWPAFFIKDYVKSLKTTAGSLITTPGEAKRVVDDMRKFRGTIEGGLCVRRVERFLPDSETRYFVVHGRSFACEDTEVPSIVKEVAARIEHPFFSVDVATTETGEQRVVEIGDGQVSDLVGWSAARFVRMWQHTA